MAGLYDMTKLIGSLDDISAKKVRHLYREGLYSSVLRMLNEMEKKETLPHDPWKLKIETLFEMDQFQEASDENARLIAAFAHSHLDDTLIGKYDQALVTVCKVECELEKFRDNARYLKHTFIKKVDITP